MLYLLVLANARNNRRVCELCNTDGSGLVHKKNQAKTKHFIFQIKENQQREKRAAAVMWPEQ